METKPLDLVDDLCGHLRAVHVVALLDQPRQLAKVEDFVAKRHAGQVVVHAGLAEGQDVVEDDATDGGDDDLGSLGLRLRGAMRVQLLPRHAHANHLTMLRTRQCDCLIRGTLLRDIGQYLQTVVTSPAFLPERVPYGCEHSPIAGRFRPRVTPLDAGAFLFVRPPSDRRSRR